VTSVLFSPLDRLISPSGGFQIILEDLRFLVSEHLLELLLWGKVFHFWFWATKRSVNWIRLNEPKSSNWGRQMNSFLLKHHVVASAANLGNSTIICEVELGVLVVGLVHRILVNFHLFAILLFGVSNTLLGLLLLGQVLGHVILRVTCELEIVLVQLSCLDISNKEEYCETQRRCFHLNIKLIYNKSNNLSLYNN